MNQQQIIDDIVNKAKEDLQKYIEECKLQSSSLCDLALKWKDLSYERIEIQHLYMLRYFYAYLLEYKWLFNFIVLDNFKILSVGCGAYLDLLGLSLSSKSQGKNIEYWGIDPIDWYYRRYVKEILPDNYNISYTKLKFEDFVDTTEGKSILEKVNVIVFPKSIEYMDTAIWDQIVNNTNFQEEKIYLIMNAMDLNYKNDSYKIDYLVKLLEKKGTLKTRK